MRWEEMQRDRCRRQAALAERVRRLPHALQITFAAGCAERALPLLEYDGYADTAGAAPGFIGAFRAAVEVVWSAATRPADGTDVRAVRRAVTAVFPTGDFYAGYDATVGSGAAILCALDAVDDPSGREAADAALHVASAWEQVTQWDDQPADEGPWQAAAVERLERHGDRPVTRDVFDTLPPVPRLGAE